MTTSLSRSAGFVYVATGERYVTEARTSAAHLRRIHPTLPICLITDAARGDQFWDDLIVLENPTFGFRDKMNIGLSPYEKSLFLDTDTLVIGSLDEVFTLLDRFDIAGQQLFEGHDYRAPGVPDAFPEFNTGVVAFRRSPALTAFFAQWRALYDTYLATDATLGYHYENVSDQKSFRVALYESDLRFAVLTPEYNFVPHHVNFACAPVRVLHGRGDAQLVALAARINVFLGCRSYVPVLDTVVSAHTPAAELRRLWWLTGWQLLRHAGRALAPRRLRDRIRHLPLVRSLFLRNRFVQPGVSAEHARKWREPPKA